MHGFVINIHIYRKARNCLSQSRVWITLGQGGVGDEQDTWGFWAYHFFLFFFFVFKWHLFFFWLIWVLLDWGLLSSFVVQPSHCSGFSCWGGGLEGVGASVVAAPRLERTGSAIVVQGLAALKHVGSSQTRGWTRVSCIGRQILYHWATRKPLTISGWVIVSWSLCFFVQLWLGHMSVPMLHIPWLLKPFFFFTSSHSFRVH